MASHVSPLAEWTPALVDAACRRAHGHWQREHENRYEKVLRSRGVERTGRFVTAERRDLLPSGYATQIEKLIEPGEWHRHSRSAKSSQTLAAGFFGPAILDREPAWAVLARALAGVDTGSVLGAPRLEHALDRSALNEQGVKTTSLDLFIETDRMVIGVECKRFEDGVGRCSCRIANPDPPPKTRPAWQVAACKDQVLDREAYWRVGQERFGLRPRRPGRPCPIALSYQAVRNIAALDVLREGRQALWVLVHDRANPYFHETGDWPGWPSVLGDALGDSFRAVSWQDLAPSALGHEGVVEWAGELHGIFGAGQGE